MDQADAQFNFVLAQVIDSSCHSDNAVYPFVCYRLLFLVYLLGVYMYVLVLSLSVFVGPLTKSTAH